MIRARLVQAVSLTADIKTYYFQPSQPISFLAGQYIELFLPHDDVDERGPQRWFTISSAPFEDTVALTVRLPERRSSSFKAVLRNLQPGDEVEFGEVLGDFVVPKNKQVPLVFVAGGVGIAPFASMIKDLAHHNDKRHITLFYGTRHAQEQLFSDVFHSYDLQPHFALGEPLDVEQIYQPTVTGPQPLYYLAGSETMVIGMQTALIQKGVRPMHIALDYFPGYLEA